MEISTKFNLNDKVFGLSTRVGRTEIQCPKCKGKGELKFDGFEEYADCPECYGSGKTYEKERTVQYAITPGRIGRMDVEFYSSMSYIETHYRGKRKICCMLDTTGVGSGTLWDEKDLFPSEAMAEMEAENRKRKYEEDYVNDYVPNRIVQDMPDSGSSHSS